VLAGCRRGDKENQTGLQDESSLFLQFDPGR
jgi:hypothetical protein